MKLRTIAEGKLATAGHVAFDVAGLIPGWGEPADLANALWYAENGEYLDAAFSLISTIPGLGDMVGKGAKYLGKSSTLMAKFLSKHGDDIAKYWPKVLATIEKLEDWEPFIREIDEIIKKILPGDDPEPIDRVGPHSETTDDLQTV